MYNLESLIRSEAPELLEHRICLIRHQLRDDPASGLQNADPLSKDQKLQTLRSDARVLQAFTSEFGGNFPAKYQDCDVMLVSAPPQEGGLLAEFLGVFEVEGTSTFQEWQHHYRDVIVPGRFDDEEFIGLGGLGCSARAGRAGGQYFKIAPLACPLNELRRRLVVRWSGGAINWVQGSDGVAGKEVIEIRARGFIREWTGYLNWAISLVDLEQMVMNCADNLGITDWERHLSSAAGVYCIADTRNGKLYVGSAYGKDGLWGRLQGYGRAPFHNGNLALRRLIEAEGDSIRKHLRVSILRVFDSNAKRTDVIQHENLLKQKLCSRAPLGYNEN